METSPVTTNESPSSRAPSSASSASSVLSVSSKELESMMASVAQSAVKLGGQAAETLVANLDGKQLFPVAEGGVRRLQRQQIN